MYFLKTKNGKEIEDMTACMTLKEAIEHGMRLVKKYGNINITMSMRMMHSWIYKKLERFWCHASNEYRE